MITIKFKTEVEREITPHQLGKLLAEADGDEQAQALNSFADVSESWGRGRQDTQLLLISDGLSLKTVDLLERLLEFAKEVG